MRRIELSLTDDEHKLFNSAAARAKLTIEQWAYCCLVADARAEERRSPRRDPGAQDRSTIISMVRCPNCGIKTRSNVAACDNCDTVLR